MGQVRATLFGSVLSEAVRNEKRSELFTLKQGDSIVTEFEMRLSSLASFTTAQLSDDFFKATIIEAGLRPNIHWAIAVFPLVSNADIVTRSLAIEAKKVVLKKDRDASTPSNSVQTSSSQPHWKRRMHQAYSTPHSF